MERGVETDKPRSLRIAKKACGDGAPLGCARYGWWVARGLGTERNRAVGLRYLRRACRAGEPFGCDKLSFLGGGRP